MCYFTNKAERTPNILWDAERNITNIASSRCGIIALTAKDLGKVFAVFLCPNVKDFTTSFRGQFPAVSGTSGLVKKKPEIPGNLPPDKLKKNSAGEKAKTNMQTITEADALAAFKQGRRVVRGQFIHQKKSSGIGKKSGKTVEPIQHDLPW